MPADGANPWIRIVTPELTNLTLIAMEGTEAVSALFDYRLDLQTPLAEPLDDNLLVGKRVRIELSPPGGQVRWIHGVLRELAEIGADDAFIHYHGRLAPELWFATQNVDCRIFQQKSVPEIVREVFAAHSVSYELHENHRAHNFRVQYNESDFDFASRLMEEEGIYFTFRHDGDQCTLVLSDRSTESPKLEPERIAYDAVRGGSHRDGRIWNWKRTRRANAAATALTDHSFQLAGHKLTCTSGQPEHHSEPLDSGRSPCVIHEYPAWIAHRFDEIGPTGAERAGELDHVYSENERLALVRQQERTASSWSIEGESNVAALACGHRFELTGADRHDGGYWIERVELAIRNPPTRSEDGGAPADCRFRFSCLPADVPFRTPRRTIKPLIRGTQTAVVVGSGTPDEQEVSCDKYGRVKVKFHWDRSAASDLTSSCWIRVSQSWAGKGFGSVHLPRIGNEVIVAFENGDPDAPVILGSVYNSQNMPPYDLPGERRVAGFHSRSMNTPGGPEKSSHVLFVDDHGSEQLHVHAEQHAQFSAEESMVHLVGWGAHHSSETSFLAGSGAGGDHGVTHEFVGSGSATEPGVGSGSGAGPGSGSIFKTKGFANTSVWGEQFQVVVGTATDVVAGAWANVHAGIGADVKVGFEMNALFGSRIDAHVGNRSSFHFGANYEYTKGDVVEEVRGSALQFVTGSAISTYLGSNVVEEWAFDAKEGDTNTVFAPNGMNVLVRKPSGIPGSTLAKVKEMALSMVKEMYEEHLKTKKDPKESEQEKERKELSDKVDSRSALNLLTEAGDINIGCLATSDNPSTMLLTARRIEIVAEEIFISAKKKLTTLTGEKENDNNEGQEEYFKARDAKYDAEERLEKIHEELTDRLADAKKAARAKTALGQSTLKKTIPGLLTGAAVTAAGVVAAVESKPSKW